MKLSTSYEMANMLHHAQQMEYIKDPLYHMELSPFFD